MADLDRRYIVIPKGADAAGGFDTRDGAEAAAKAFGDGCDVIDTNAALYQPIVSQVQGDEMVYLEYGGWGPKPGLGGGLIEAARKGYAPIVKAFLARGADPAATDPNGATALTWAVAKGDADSVRDLLAAGANPGHPDHHGVTPLDLARRKKHDSLAALLEAAVTHS